MTGNDGSPSFCCKGVLYCVLLYFLVIPLFDSSFFINSRSHFVDRDEEKFSKQLSTGITRELLRDDHHGEEGKLVWTIFINISESMREKKGMKEREKMKLIYSMDVVQEGNHLFVHFFFSEQFHSTLTPFLFLMPLARHMLHVIIIIIIFFFSWPDLCVFNPRHFFHFLSFVDTFNAFLSFFLSTL